MSKPLHPVSLLIIIFSSAVVACAQDVDATIRIDFKNQVVTVNGRDGLRRPSRNMSFIRSAPGIDNLAARISELQLWDAGNRSIAFKKFADGEYLADAEFNRWSYKVDLTPAKNRSAAAHASWLADGRGIVMLADILPTIGTGTATAKIAFETTSTRTDYGSYIHTSESRKDDHFEVRNIEDAIFYVGSGWERGRSPTDRFPGTLIVNGAWTFAPEDASGITKEIHDSYARVMGSGPPSPPFIAIAKFPNPVGFGEWAAETRGSNVTIISSDMPFRNQSLQRLHEQLRHELFHLWIPNGVDLSGNYDWFYEGFALYQSLKLAVALNRIRFEDFLDTLSRAHTIDSAVAQRASLVEASKTRFAGSNTQVYARGMLVAFLTDLALLQRSKGNWSVENVLRELYAKHRKPAASRVDGNKTVIDLLKTNAGDPIVEKYVTGRERIEWAAELAVAGISDADPGPLTTLQVNEKLNGGQKTLLDRLGYNNWRKLSR